ncbi:hypothetical protein MHU86_8315 [Fragilaria crotonensis]|nr:hypothetical protein MHU86_8315 [Fragilaria crotonensis]
MEHQLGPGLGKDDVLLSQGDSTSATGWMAKSSFGDECPILLAVARELASYLANHQLVHYSQWFPGKENSVADALSRDFELTDEEIVSLVRDNFPEQVPKSFRIVPMPEAVITDVGRLLRLQPRTQQLPTTPAPSAAAAGRGTRASCQPSGTGGATRSLGSSSPKTVSISSLASQRHFAKVGTGIPDSLLDVALEGRRAQFVPPSTTWHRPTGLTNLAVRCTTRGRLDAVLAAQLRSYALEDPEPERPQAIPAAVVSVVAKAVETEVRRAVGQLVVCAFFFAMRSCEYSEVSGDRRTQVLRVGDLDFRKGGRSVDLVDSPLLMDADTVSVTYRSQKNGDRGVTVTQHRTEGVGQPRLCPVRSFANLAMRVSQYEVNDRTEWESVRDRPINLVVSGGRVALISSHQILNHLRAGALLYGEERLGFPISRIGTHSLRSGAATAMFIAGVPTETIQLIGRWKSQTFLRYIRIQVQQLTQGVASGMIEHPNFFTIGRQLERPRDEHGRANRQRRGKDLGEDKLGPDPDTRKRAEHRSKY